MSKIVYGYRVAASEEVLQDEDALDRLKSRVTESFTDGLESENYTLISTPKFYQPGKPFKSYNEDGEWTGYMVEFVMEGMVAHADEN